MPNDVAREARERSKREGAYFLFLLFGVLLLSEVGQYHDNSDFKGYRSKE